MRRSQHTPKAHPEGEKHFRAARVGNVAEVNNVAGLPPNHSQSRSATSRLAAESAMSPVREAMYATSRPYESRATASIASCVADSFIVENDFDCDNLRDASRNP